MHRVAVIGAGLAGLTCAQGLRARGWDVTVFEKSRGAGGRLSTRRTELAQYDHGAQYFTVRDPQFEDFIGQRLADSSVAVWSPKMAHQVDEKWYVATPGMSALGRAQAQGLDLRTQTRVVALVRSANRWTIQVEGAQAIDGFDSVVVAVPNEQAVPLLQPHAPLWAKALGQIPMQPCWTLMFSTRDPLIDFDAGLPSDSPVGWWARNSSKPGRPVNGGRHDWVIQAQSAWSATHVDTDKAAVAHALLDAFAQAIGAGAIEPIDSPMVHRWLYARRTPGLAVVDEPWWQPQIGLGVCGDGLSHSRVEQAYLSGRHLADTMTQSAVS